jgi:nitronate monooxygenase
MTHWSRAEVLIFLNLMLEAERAGAKALLRLSLDTRVQSIAQISREIQKDEAHWCAMLSSAIEKLDGEPSAATGDFYEKVLALGEDEARLALVNRGQGWVVRKLREAIPRITDKTLASDLEVMLASHEKNIDRVAQSGLIGVG